MCQITVNDSTSSELDFMDYVNPLLKNIMQTERESLSYGDERLESYSLQDVRELERVGADNTRKENRWETE